jgi:phosphotransferase system HPr (HPr) family protein
LVGFDLETIATRSVIVVNPQGFHARPAHLFVKLAGSFSCEVEIAKGNEVINGKSILDLLTLGAGNGTTLVLRASGPDCEAAVEALAQLIEQGFGEMPAPGEK